MQKIGLISILLALAMSVMLGFTGTTTAIAQPTEVWVDDGYCDGCPNDGHTWGYDAFDQIQDGIDAVASPAIVHVAAGTYYENITMKSGVTIQGAGQGVSIIDGNASGSVVTAIGVDSTATLDGFTITNGDSAKGGGMYISDDSSPSVTNCTFSGNSAEWGGGMYTVDSQPTVTNCTFSGNTGSERGGGMYIYWYCSPTLTNCTFSGNTAAHEGGGMYNETGSRPRLTNCTFSGNSAHGGGGMYNSRSGPTLTNCTFLGNSAEWGGGIVSSSPTTIPSTTITNCILWGDSPDEINLQDVAGLHVTYSDIQGSFAGTGNINSDPLFVDPDGADNIIGTEDDDYHLTALSPCIDTGTNGAPSIPDTDFEGDERLVDGDNDSVATVDMGIDEYIPGPNQAPTAHAGSDQTVDEGVTVTLDGSNSSDPDDGIASYLWSQTGGTSVTLSDPTSIRPSFVTPAVNTSQIELIFQITVTDNGGIQSSDEVSVAITDNGITGFPSDVVTMTSSTGDSIGVKEESGGNCVSLRAIDPSTIADTTNRPENLIYGLIEMHIKTDTMGGTVTLTLYLPTQAPGDCTWFKYSSANGWLDFSANATFNATRDQVTLTLTDGSAGDDDGSPNGMIIDPSGLGRESAPGTTPAPTSSGDGCFISIIHWD